MKNILALTKRNFCNKRLTGYDKMNLILERQKVDNDKYKTDNKLIENKISDLISYTQVFRSPLYFSTFYLIWQNPLTYKYSYTLLFNNYYLLTLTGLEGAVLFSHALVYYGIVKPAKQESQEIMKERMKANRKRLMMLLTFFTGLVVALNFFNNGKPILGLLVSFLLNFYLYAKVSFHITYKLVNNTVYMPRMKFIYTNMFFSLLLFLINYYKRKMITSNLTY
jgi:hypothetical protein